MPNTGKIGSKVIPLCLDRRFIALMVAFHPEICEIRTGEYPWPN